MPLISDMTRLLNTKSFTKDKIQDIFHDLKCKLMMLDF